MIVGEKNSKKNAIEREVVEEGISFVLYFISFCRLENKGGTLGLLVTTVWLKRDR